MSKAIVVVGAQWGDEGKGKVVDYLAGGFDYTARFAGGHNAGHTVIHGDKRFVLQLIPCGILRPGKHAVIGLTRSAALDYAAKGIRINAVCPGMVNTPMAVFVTKNYDPDMVRRMVAQEPIGRFGEPEEIAAAVVWLCSPAASFMVGHAMAVDGGLLAG